MSKDTSKNRSIMIAFDWYDHRIYRGIAQYCAEQHWHLSPYFFSERRVPKNWSGDGAIVCYGEDNAGFIEGMDIPMVDVTIKKIPKKIPRVVVDDQKIGVRAAKHFIQRGYKQFAYFSWDVVEVNQARKKAFFDSLIEAGIETKSIHTINQPEDDVITDWKAHQSNLIEQLSNLPRPLAVFTGQDNLGATLIEACTSAGIIVPDEVAVLGVDNIEFLCECAFVPLSSIDVHLSDLGYAAAEQLGRLMDGEIDNDEPPRIVPVGDVIMRRSTDGLAVSHPAVVKALELMRREFRNGLVLEDVYEHVGLSKRGMEKAFKKHLANSPAAVLRQIRLNYAKNRLSQTDVKIEAIAAECGYSNSSNLSHAFNRDVGMSPLEYRNTYRSALR